MIDLRNVKLYPPSEDWHDQYMRVFTRFQQLGFSGVRGFEVENEMAILRHELQQVNVAIARLVGGEHYFALWQICKFTPFTKIEELPELKTGRPVYIHNPIPLPLHGPDGFPVHPSVGIDKNYGKSLLTPVVFDASPRRDRSAAPKLLSVAYYHHTADILYYAELN